MTIAITTNSEYESTPLDLHMYALWMLTSLVDMSHNNNIIETGNSVPLYTMMLYMHIYYCALRGLRAARFGKLRVPTLRTLLQLLARCSPAWCVFL
jgi:hypothetical protein